MLRGHALTVLTPCNFGASDHEGSWRWRFAVAAIVAFLIAPVTGHAGSRGQRPSDEFLVSEGKAGAIEVGMSVDEVRQMFGRDRVRVVDLDKEGHFSPAIEIDLPGASVRTPVTADITQGPCGVFSLSGITIRDPRFRTADGLGVGSTLAELQRRRSVRISREEGWWAIVPDAKISFGLEAVPAAGSARVALIWLWLEARTVREQRCPDR